MVPVVTSASVQVGSDTPPGRRAGEKPEPSGRENHLLRSCNESDCFPVAGVGAIGPVEQGSAAQLPARRVPDVSPEIHWVARPMPEVSPGTRLGISLLKGLEEVMKVRPFALVSGCIVAAALFASTIGTVPLASAATPHSSGNLYPIDYKVNATTTLAKLNETVKVPTGSFIGSLNLNNFVLSGKLNLPPASTTFNLAGIGLAKATFKLSETKLVTGKVNLNSLKVTATSSFNVLVTSVEPLGLPVNLVGNSCGTSKPVSVTFSGPFSFSGASTFSGKYTIPPLQNCELATPALNLLIPGPNNVFKASFAPAS